MAAEQALYEVAPAKINLYLHVTGKRDDGYHLLDSLVSFAAVGDILVFQPAPVISFVTDGPFADDLPSLGENIVITSGQRLREAFGLDGGAFISLTKNLPVASGIGGGSADAAATLRGLCRLWDLDYRSDKVMDVALSLGADVPVCLHGKTCVMRGIGEELVTVPEFEPLAAVLVNPGVGVSTPDVFKARQGPFSESVSWPGATATEAVLAALGETRNDLEVPAVSGEPIIDNVLTALAELPGARLFRMSGSGATCFAIFDNPEAAEMAATTLSSAHQDWWIQSVQIG